MVTVLMATHNGAAWIERSLMSMTAVVPPPQGWKLIVVNNGSTDGTAAILHRFAERLPLQVLHRARPGKNAALNLGLKHIEGDLVAFADDDVLVDPHWLVQLTAAAHAEPGYAAFGGCIRPEWPRPPEQWILDWVPLGPAFVLTPPARRGPCPPESVWGPNMAVPAEVFRSGFQFDESIGPDGSTRYAMGSETSLTRRLAAAGQRCFHVPEAVVTHLIRPGQMTREWIVRRAFRAGRGKGVLAQEIEPSRALAGVPRYFLRQAAEAALRFAAAKLRSDARGAFRAAWEWNYALGCISGARAAWLSAAAPAPRPAYAGVPSLHAPAPG